MLSTTCGKPHIHLITLTNTGRKKTPHPLHVQPSNLHIDLLTKKLRKEEERATTMSFSPSLTRPLHSPFLSSHHPKLSSSLTTPHHRTPKPNSSYPCIRAIEFDQNTVVSITVGVVSVAVGIGIPVFYETQIDSAAKRENTQPCFPCNGSGAQQCRFCAGTGSVTVALGAGEEEVSRCINCDGAGSLTCTTCQGSRIQPRYLDRREFKDDD